MQKFIFLFAAAGVMAATTLVSCTNTQAKPEAAEAVSKDSLIKRGNYLVAAMGCDDCHSPKLMGPRGPQLDLEHRFSGFPAERPIAKADVASLKNGWLLFGGDLTSSVGPWGMSFAANISSDATGIGNWSEEQFFTAIRNGKSKGLEANRDLLPPMPWQNFKNLSDEDLRAIFLYLKTTKPVHNIVPEPKAPTQL